MFCTSVSLTAILEGCTWMNLCRTPQISGIPGDSESRVRTCFTWYLDKKFCSTLSRPPRYINGVISEVQKNKIFICCIYGGSRKQKIWGAPVLLQGVPHEFGSFMALNLHALSFQVLCALFSVKSWRNLILNGTLCMF